MATRKIERVVVLGAGVMGAQIAALLAAAGKSVRLLDMPAGGDLAGGATSGLKRLEKIRPPAFFVPEMAKAIEVGGFEQLECVQSADWVIEAIVEEIGPKRDLLARIEPYLHEELVISSNTSGLSIAELAKDRSQAFRRCFLGVHFFNPPRYMNLVELIPGEETDADLLESMREFLYNELGKGVVLGRDTPNFIGNRMWIFAACDMLHRMHKFGLSVEQVDMLTGPLMGRPKSGTLRVCDIVGLDTVAHVAATSYAGLENDPWRDHFQLPDFYLRMVDDKLLGAKVNAGFYRKGDDAIEAIDLENLAYRPLRKIDLGDLESALGERSAQSRLLALWHDRGPQSQQGREHLLAVLAYAATHAAEMAGDIVPVDQAMRWGFNWDLGPFEIWDLLGVDEVVRALEEAQQPVPDLAVKLMECEDPQFYQSAAESKSVFSAVNFQRETWQPLTDDKDQLNLDRAIWSNGGAYLVELAQGTGALVFNGKMNALGPEVLEAVHHAVDTAPFEGLVLCGAGGLFSVGADLKHMAGLVDREDWQGLEDFVAAFQAAVQALRHASFPVVAAVQGLALGGGCEFALAADARIAAAELRMGLVETKVGLIPGSGGCMEMARRGGDDLLSAFDTVFAGNFSGNAYQARAWGMLNPVDEIALGEGPLLQRSVNKLRALLADEYTAPDSRGVQVKGDEGLELLHREIDSRLQGGIISEHDAVVGRGLARVMAGDGGEGRIVEEQTMLDLEREVFLELCSTEMTRARIDHMLKTGKPLKN